MAKLSKKLSIAMFCVFALVLGMFCLTGCGKVEASIQFMVPENGAGEYKLYSDVKVNEDGTFNLPEEPSIYGYVFRSWYEDSECTVLFEDTKVKKDMVVYALLDEVKITVSIKNGEGKEETINEQALISLDELTKEHSKKAKEANLTFDGWYTNPECTTPYNKESGSVKLYARYVANVVFDNGYEQLKTQKVVPGQLIEEPKTSEIIKNYMDEEDIFFVDENNETYDFSSPVTQNTVVRVLWKTPGLEYIPIEGTAEYRITGFDTKIDKAVVETYPVLSIPGKATVDGNLVDVVAVNGGSLYQAKSATKIIVNEGIKQVTSLSAGPFGSAVEAVELPSSLRILEDSIRGFVKLKELVIKEGVEVIIDSFWADKDYNVNRHTGYTFDIVIPKTVKNISLVPNTLKYAEGSEFLNEGNFVFKNDETLGKVMVSVIDSEVDPNGRLIIPEGVKAIQVGSLYGLKYEYLILPKSFEKVSYNNERTDYPYYTGYYLTVGASVETEANPTLDKSMSDKAYAIVNDLNDHKYVSFDNTQLPEGMNKFAFIDSHTSYDKLETLKVVFVGELTEGEAKVTISYFNPMADSKVKEVNLKVNVGEKITKEQVLEACKISEEELGYSFKIEELSQFGLDYDFNQNIKSNQYINIIYKFSATGVTYEELEDGTLAIKGFDKDTAQKLENGTYLVAIPASVDGKQVTKINASAFENVGEISKVYIPNTIKEIGDKAFRNTKNLDFVNIVTGGLEVIGEAAFEYAGSLEQDGKYICNPDLTKYDNKKTIPSLKMILPLGNLKEVKANAFNSPAIREFTPTDEEKSRAKFGMFNMEFSLKGKFKENEFYFHEANVKVGIIKFTKVQTVPDSNNEIVHDVDYVATAAGYNGTSKFSMGLVLKNGMSNSGYIRYTVKRGSISLYESTPVVFALSILKKVEKGAVTYLNEEFYKVNDKGASKFTYMQKDEDNLAGCFTRLTEITTQDSKIFEEGWITGRTNEENKVFMQAAQIYGGTTPGM